ncbi:MAG TPA: ATP-binding protein [Actinoallomurus sp.]|jgi:anti-sigma regulatory factor (Ser/Thr protein kinase)
MPVYSTTCSSGTDGRPEPRRPHTATRDRSHVLPPLTVFEPGADAPGGAVCALRPASVSSRTAREFATDTLNSWGLSQLVDDAVVIISELVTNAVRHGVPPYAAAAGDMPIKLSLVRQGRFLVLIVADPSDQGPELRPADDVCENGRGLHVIEALSHVWGWTPLGDTGKAVWAALPLH